MQKQKKIRGSFVCKGKLVDPKTNGQVGTAQNGSDKEGGASTLAVMNGALGLAAMFAVFVL